MSYDALRNYGLRYLNDEISPVNKLSRSFSSYHVFVYHQWPTRLVFVGRLASLVPFSISNMDPASQIVHTLCDCHALLVQLCRRSDVCS